MDVTLKINGVDLSSRLSTYDCTHEISYTSSVVTMDGVEHFRGKVDKTVITFSLFPMSDEEAKADYDLLNHELFDVEFTDPRKDYEVTARMRLASNLAGSFGLRSINGKRYYKGGAITLRQGG